ncbi:MAG: D-alanyl-D-alanine carboxypeptidase family protein [Acidimicrobiia bacterium]|nr:D-alanyl-D-alanine carboxypeptidase family protein [Acidimicrobiia bacterium]
MMNTHLSLLSMLVAVTMTASPITAPPMPEPVTLEAEAWIAVDLDSGATLLGFNEDEERPMASVTKLMTALVVRDHADLDARIRVSEAAAAIGEAEIGLVAGEVWSVRDLLAAVLVRSGNDAAYALAEHVGGSIEGFAALMNAKAAELGLEHSNFKNPHGLDEDGHYTSARDLTTIGGAVLEDDVLAQFTRTGIIRFKPAPDGTDRIAVNTNRLLNHYPGVIGLKTGYTGKAGRVLVSAYEVEGQTIAVVVMGSEDHFADTAAILDYLGQAYSIRDRLLLPLVEPEGGGTAATALDPSAQLFAKTRHELPTGREVVTPWGETPGSQAVEDMVRQMIPVVLGGTT